MRSAAFPPVLIFKRITMSKNPVLWNCIKNCKEDAIALTFAEIGTKSQQALAAQREIMNRTLF